MAHVFYCNLFLHDVFFVLIYITYKGNKLINNIHMKEIIMYPDGRVDTRNAATYVGLAEKTLAMMRCNGTGPKFVKRGRIFYFREDLDRWLNAGGRFTSTAQAQQAPD